MDEIEQMCLALGGIPASSRAKGLGPQPEKNPVSALKTRSAVLGVGFLGSEWAFKQTHKSPVNLKLSATSNLVSR